MHIAQRRLAGATIVSSLCSGRGLVSVFNGFTFDVCVECTPGKSGLFNYINRVWAMYCGCLSVEGVKMRLSNLVTDTA